MPPVYAGGVFDLNLSLLKKTEEIAEHISMRRSYKKSHEKQRIMIYYEVRYKILYRLNCKIDKGSKQRTGSLELERTRNLNMFSSIYIHIVNQLGRRDPALWNIMQSEYGNRKRH